MRTCFFPFLSALTIVFKQSERTFILTIGDVNKLIFLSIYNKIIVYTKFSILIIKFFFQFSLIKLQLLHLLQINSILSLDRNSRLLKLQQFSYIHMSVRV
jgi:hypothetical protein